MTYTLTEIYTAVRTAIDEIALNDASFLSGQDNTEMETIIRQKACEAADCVHMTADLSRFYGDVLTTLTCPDSNRPGCTSAGSDLVAHITLNGGIDSQYEKNMLRFAHAMVYTSQGADRWSYPVTDLTYDHADEYAEIRDPYAGATVDRPAVALRHVRKTNSDSTELELWKLGSSSDIAAVRLIERAKITGSGGTEAIGIDKNLYDAFILQLAALTLATYNEEGRADTLFQLSNREMGIETPQQRQYPQP